MSELVTEILIGIVIMTLIMLVIMPLYSQVQHTLNDVLFRSSGEAPEKVLFGMNSGSAYSGGEVIAQINYFCDYPNRKITVINSGGTMSYIVSGYDAEEFPIELNEAYSFSEEKSEELKEYVYKLIN